MSTAIYFPQPIEIDEEPDPTCLEPPSRRWSPVARRGLAITLLLTIGAALAVGAMTLKPVEPALPNVVAGTAELAIRQFLSESGERYVVGTTVVYGRRLDDTWTVTVAAELLALTESGYVVDGLHYFDVRLSAHDGIWQVAGAPAHVAGSVVVPLRPLTLEPPNDSAVVTAIQGYVDWFLTGAEGAYDMARPVPAPFVSATITGLRITPGPRETSLASVQVLGLDRFGHTLDLSYELILVLHRGSWMVATDEASKTSDRST
ncbi:MAG: hypothetical protein OEY98_03385 [Acidimicrobiia bacterium]|nr:hypothetical protein [Acidimicrobiia bacterium]